ncbi:MAG: sulfatase-like hydrolase/transferase [Simkania negevensis]|nr:sulfatase-like hydrolase/transferase [Simkania negevensis]
MDISFFYALDMMLDETWENFIELLHITGVSLKMWFTIFIIALIAIPLCSLLVYHLTAKIPRKHWLYFSTAQIVKLICIIPVLLITLELVYGRNVKFHEIRLFQRTLPWKTTFLPLEHEQLKLKGPLKPLMEEGIALKTLHSTPIALAKKPNIYLFIAESLREDFLTDIVAKNIADFRGENISLGMTFSNANATQISWYSIFSANYPFHWASKEQKKWCSGALPLQVLKKLGYRLHVYSSAPLRFYGMGEKIFGKRYYLTDKLHIYPHYWPKQACESDQLAVDHLVQDLDKPWAKEGNLFIVFLDSTHFNYSWPKKTVPFFTPISEEQTQLKVSNSLRDIELIKNRYRNSIHYVDSLFGKVISTLKKKELYKESVVLFTGDHGEEFFEEGQLFHASHLSRMQTRVPIYYKLGDNRIVERIDPNTTLTSHIDIFPTLLDYLIGEQPFFSLFQGESIFKKNRFPYVIAGRHNGSRCPFEFFLHDGKMKVISRFFPEKDIFNAKSLELISIQDVEGKDIMDHSKQKNSETITKSFQKAFEHIFLGLDNAP